MGFFNFLKARPAPAKVAPAGDGNAGTPPEAHPPVAAPTLAVKAATAAGAGFTGPVIIRTLATEKATRLVAAGQHAFRIHPTANKAMVRSAFVERFGVSPLKITLLNVPARQVRFGRVKGRRSGYKKAVVCLPPGTKIEVEKNSS